MNFYMEVKTRHQVGNGDHTPFIFKKLETPPKCPRKHPCDNNIESPQAQTANVQHKLLYSFENLFGTPFETPKDTNDIVTMVHLNEIKHFLEEQARETQNTLDAIYAMEIENQHVDTKNQACYWHSKLKARF